MADRLTTIEVVEELGQAAPDPPVSPAGRARTYYNTDLDEERQSLDGSVYTRITRIGGEDWVPLPVDGTPTPSTADLDSVLVGGMYYCPEPISPTRCLANLASFNAADTIVVAAYQCPNGQSGTAALVGSGSLAFGGSGPLDIPFSGHIQKGVYHLLWARTGAVLGNGFTTYGNDSLDLITFPFSTIPNGLHATIYATNQLGSNPLPASLDLTVGGGVVSESSNPLLLVHRWAQ